MQMVTYIFWIFYYNIYISLQKKLRIYHFFQRLEWREHQLTKIQWMGTSVYSQMLM